MFAGISTACFYPALTERALEYLARFGAEAAEVFFNAPSELEDPLLLRMSCAARAAGVRILSVHPFTSGLEPLLFFSEYERRHRDGIEIYKRYFHAANQLGAQILVFHGDRRGSEKPESLYFDRFGELMEAGRRMGVLVAQENVPRCASWDPVFFARMRENLPDARFVLDVKQCIRSGVTVDEMLAGMGDRIVHLHLSDHDETNDCLPVGKGSLDLPALLKKLRTQGFNGGVMLELYRNSYGDYQELEESYRKIFLAVHGEIE